MAVTSIILGPIVGGLNHKGVNIWVRTNGQATLYVWLARKENLQDAALAGNTELKRSNGFAGIVSINKLQVETRYFYAVSTRKIRPAKKQFHSFVTFPRPSTKRSFTFMFGSCYLPGSNDTETFTEISKDISRDDLRFGIFIGDQIYADHADNNGINKIAVSLDEYRSVYRYTWSRPAIKKLLPDLPLFMTLDDHEVEDDWRFDNHERTSASIPYFNRVIRFLKRVPPDQRTLSIGRVQNALKAYHEHQAIHAPKMLLPFKTDNEGHFLLGGDKNGSFAYEFTYGAAAFFVLDSRSMRIKKGKNSMLGDAQWKKLEAWFLKVKDKYPVKFFVTSGTVFHPFLGDVGLDRWSGFRRERNRLFKFIAENEIQGVHILTGDLHSAHAISAEIKCPSGKRIPIWEYCSTPFEQTTIKISAAYLPLLSKWVGKQKKLFHQTGNNFGVVHVNFDGSAPQVKFKLHYFENGWKVRETKSN